MKALRAKQILITGLVALVLVAGYYRWTEENKALEVSNISVPVSSEKPEVSKIGKDYQNFEDESAVYANAEAEPNQDSDSGNGSENSGAGNFDNEKRERDSVRGQSLDMLKEILNSESSTKEAKSDAEKKISDSAANAQSEGIIEGMVKSKGFSDCIVYIDNGEVRVVVKAEKLEADNVSQIKDIVVSQTGIKPKNIKISSKP